MKKYLLCFYVFSLFHFADVGAIPVSLSMMANSNADNHPVHNCGYNWHNEILIPIVERILPQGQEGWNDVAATYKEASGEPIPCDADDIKTNWGKKYAIISGSQ